MLSLGIDPGTAIVGYGFVKEHNDGSLEAIHYGVIRTKPKTPMPERLQIIYDNLSALIEKYQPDRSGVEELFFARNVTTAITVAQARGVILLSLTTPTYRLQNINQIKSNNLYQVMVVRIKHKCKK